MKLKEAGVPTPQAPASPQAPAAPVESNESPAAQAPAHTTKRSAKLPAFKGGAYDHIMRRAGLLVSFGVVAAIWYAGAWFTLAMLDQWFAVSYGVTWWLLAPAALTVLEIGLQSVRNKYAVGLWWIVFGADAGSTAWGIWTYNPIERLAQIGISVDVVLAFALCFGFGSLIALIPEKMAKGLWQEWQR